MTRWPTLAAPVLAGAARVTLGVLWIGEAALKLRSGFGAADILLVADGAAASTRVPEYFQWFAATFMASFPELFGFTVPLIELALGIALIAGALTLPAALGSVVMLLSYVLSDKLTAEYPIMIALAAVVAAFPFAASRFGVTSLIDHLRRRRQQGARAVPAALRRWL